MSPVIIPTEITENSVTIPKINSTKNSIKNSKKSFMPAELTVSNLSYQERGKQFFDQVTFTVPSGKIFGLVGQNGSGKTTLLSLISGFLQLDSGEIKIAQNAKIGFLRQDFQAPVQVSIGQIISQAYPFKLDQLLNWQEWQKIEEMLIHFGLPNHQAQLSELSGGQQRRVFLIKTLITQPDILLLDEPTNHLDIDGIEYLTNFLKQSNCTVLVISHDRAFLDEICDGMLEVWNKQIYPHTGNYSQYLKNRTARLENEAVTNQRTAQFVKRELEWVRAGVQARGTKNKGRLNKFYEIAEQEKSPQLQQAFIQIPEGKPLGNVILNFQNFCIKNQNNDKNLLLNFNLKIEKQMKIGVIGPNGTGKTSLFQGILQEAFRQRTESVSQLISDRKSVV